MSMVERASDRPRILHLSADYPDPINPRTTQVIRRLKGLVEDTFLQDVVSLNRASTLFPKPYDLIARQEVFEDGIAIAYSAPARGLWHAYNLTRLGDALAERLAHRRTPDMIVGHKLTIEGFVAARLAERLGTPYAILIQGNTDTKIAKLRPDLRPRLRHILERATSVFCLAPWAWTTLEKLLGPTRITPIMLPAPTDLDKPIQPRRGNGEVLSAFNLDAWQTKGFSTLTRAARQLGGASPPISIIGSGTEASRLRCERLASATASINFDGHVPHETMAKRMNEASGFALPSKRESFGLVFIEALFAGLPIVYPAGAAVDGYFNDMPFALRVDARNPSDVARGMATLISEESQLKAELADWQNSPHAAQFTRPTIASTFRRGLLTALGRSQDQAPVP